MTTEDVPPRQGEVADDTLKLLTSGTGFTVTAVVKPGERDVHPLLSVTLTLYTPAPAAVMPELVALCVEAV